MWEARTAATWRQCAVHFTGFVHSLICFRLSWGLWNFRSRNTSRKVAEHRWLLCKFSFLVRPELLSLPLHYSWYSSHERGHLTTQRLCSEWVCVVPTRVYMCACVHDMFSPCLWERKTSTPWRDLPQDLPITWKMFWVRTPHPTLTELWVAWRWVLHRHHLCTLCQERKCVLNQIFKEESWDKMLPESSCFSGLGPVSSC